MSQYQPRAPEANQGLKKSKVYRDTRSFWNELMDGALSPDYGALTTGFALCLALVFPALLLPATITAYYFYRRVLKDKSNKTLPMRLPAELAPQVDYNRKAIGGGFEKASGTIMLGNTRSQNKEMWVNGRDLLTHSLVIGASGSGKTETLISMSVSTAFCMGGGLMYVDAKAAVQLLVQFWTFATMFGRVDDVRIINYQIGEKAATAGAWDRRTNTTNPFAQGTPVQASNTLIGLLPAGGGDNQYFLDRAISILNTLMPALVELRDKGVLNIYPSLLSEFINLQKFMELANDKIIIPGDENDYSHISLSDRVRRPLNTFLAALPGYEPSKPPAEQPEEVKRQFGFAEGYFSRSLTNLAGQFAHIYQTEMGETDYRDIVMNNRILIVAIPGSQTMPEETAALGKVVLAAIRTAVASGLGPNSEGDKSDILDALPIDLKSPQILIVDEFAEIAVPGFSTLLTQARGLGTGCVISNQDLAGIKKANETEALQIFGNTNMKIVMKLADTAETWRTFREFAGDMEVAQASGWEKSDSDLTVHKYTYGASIQRVDKVHIDDLKEQTEGQAHLFQGADIHRIDTFYHGMTNEDLIGQIRYNRMLKTHAPNYEVEQKLKKGVLISRCIEQAANGNSYDDLTKPEVSRFSEYVRSALERSEVVGSDTHWPWRFVRSAAPVGSEAAELSSEPTEEDDTAGPSTPSPEAVMDVVQNPTTTEAPSFASSHMSAILGSPAQEEPLDDSELDVIEPETTETVEKPAASEQPKSSGSQKLASAIPEWILDVPLSGKPIGKPAEVFQTLMRMDKAMGGEGSRDGAIKLVSDIAEAVRYPTASIEKADKQLVADALNLLEGLD